MKVVILSIVVSLYTSYSYVATQRIELPAPSMEVCEQMKQDYITGKTEVYDTSEWEGYDYGVFVFCSER